MDLETAVDGLNDAKLKLRSKEGILSGPFMSEQMDRVAQYANAIEDHLADYEHDYEISEARAFRDQSLQGKSVSAAEKAAKYELAEMRGQIKKLSRLAASAWRLVGVKQSRFNHLEKEARGQV